MMRRFGVINNRNFRAQAGNDFFHRGNYEFLVIVKIEFATPGVEQLHRADSRGDLGLQVQNGGLGYFVQQFAEHFRLAIKKVLYRGESFLGATFDHVTGQSPGRCREA